MICHRSGKKKTSTSKKNSCPFSLIYKKMAISDNLRDHPSFNDENADKISAVGGVGIYYLSKFRGLHNHPLEMGYITAEVEPQMDFATVKKLCEEKSLMNKYEA